MAEFRQHVAIPPRYMMVAPILLWGIGGALVVGMTVGGVVGMTSPILLGLAFSAAAWGAAILYSKREPHAQVIVEEWLRVRIGWGGKGLPPARSRRTWAGEGNRYER